MKRLEIADREVMEIALQNEIHRSEEARYDHRLHGVLLACRGMSAYEIGELLGHDPTTIQRWIKSFEARGFSGLKDQERQGRPTRLSPEQVRTIDQDLRKSPRDFGYAQNLWDGKLLSHHIAQHGNVVLGVRQCQRLFHQLEFRLRKPRPVIARADGEAQEAFKKTPRPGRKRRR
jgi:transposase